MSAYFPGLCCWLEYKWFLCDSASTSTDSHKILRWSNPYLTSSTKGVNNSGEANQIKRNQQKRMSMCLTCHLCTVIWVTSQSIKHRSEALGIYACWSFYYCGWAHAGVVCDISWVSLVFNTWPTNKYAILTSYIKCHLFLAVKLLIQGKTCKKIKIKLKVFSCK